MIRRDTCSALAPLVKLSLHVNDEHMGRIEDTHMVICHMICYHFMDAETAE